MFCPKCGNELPNDSQFCTKCGEKQTQTENSHKHGFTAQTLQKPVHPVLTEEEQRKNNKVWLAIGGGIALFVIIMLAALFIKPSIHLNKYMQVEFEGYDTVGKAVITFDHEKFAEENGKKSDQSKDDKKGSFSFFGRIEPDYSSTANRFLQDCVSWSVSEETHLTNGDVVTLTWECDEEYALEKYGYRLKFKDEDYTTCISDMLLFVAALLPI